MSSSPCYDGKHVFLVVPVRKSSYPVSKNIIVQLASCLQSPLCNRKVILKGKELMTIISYSLVFQDPLSHLHFAYFIDVCKIVSLNTAFISVDFYWFRGSPTVLSALLCQVTLSQLQQDDLSPFNCPQAAEVNQGEEQVICKHINYYRIFSKRISVRKPERCITQNHVDTSARLKWAQTSLNVIRLTHPDSLVLSQLRRACGQQACMCEISLGISQTLKRKLICFDTLLCGSNQMNHIYCILEW